MRLALWLFLAATVPATALAQPAARDVTVARTEFAAGLEAARAGQWEAARAHFARSYEINPRLSALFNLAGAQVQTGALVAAAESYREYLGRRSEASEANVAEAQRLLDELEARIPTVRIVASGLLEDDAVSLDGVALNRLMIGARVPINPGAHTIAVERGGSAVASEAIDAVEGAALEVTLEAPPAPPPAVVAADPPPEAARVDLMPTAVEPEPEGSLLDEWWLWTIVGSVVVAGIVVGVVLAATLPAAPPDSVGFQMPAPVEVP